MKIKTVEVLNFRKLHKNVKIDLDKDITLIVGKNNSGKTSLSEIFDRFLGQGKSKFNFNDFSFACHNDYIEAYDFYIEALELKTHGEEREEEYLNKLKEAKNKLPKIILNIYIEYEKEDENNLGGFEELNLNLDDDRRDISISCLFHIKESEKFLGILKENVTTAIDKDKRESIISFTENNLSAFYKTEYFAFDKNQPDIVKAVGLSQIENAFILDLISAQRDLDDQSGDKKGRIAHCMRDFLDFSKSHDENIKELSEKLNELARKMENDHYDEIYKPVLEDFKNFGIKEEDSKLIIKAIFDAKSILKGNSRFYYDVFGRELPESHNGLGYSNLIYIALQISIFCYRFENKTPRSLSHILFIEEPEAHMHPQMQMVFIRKIRNYIKGKKWNVQLVITTHSSQILSDCDFDTIRYFDSISSYVNVKDIKDFIKKQKSKDDGIDFLQKYMNLGNCNLFFADKIIMIEGITERIILPKLIQENNLLSRQYVSIMDVGGACAHIFKNLIEFINVKTLVITDIDSCENKEIINKKGIKQTVHPACPVKTVNAITSNPVLKTWLPKKTIITDLLNCEDEDKIDGYFRVAYQIPEQSGKDCGRSFEEAFFLSNAGILEKCSDGLILKELFSSLSEKDIKEQSYEITIESSFDKKKSGIALDILSLKKWIVPKYIKDGLTWLAKD